MHMHTFTQIHVQTYAHHQTCVLGFTGPAAKSICPGEHGRTMLRLIGRSVALAGSCHHNWCASQLTDSAYTHSYMHIYAHTRTSQHMRRTHHTGVLGLPQAFAQLNLTPSVPGLIGSFALAAAFAMNWYASQLMSSVHFEKEQTKLHPQGRRIKTYLEMSEYTIGKRWTKWLVTPLQVWQSDPCDTLRYWAVLIPFINQGAAHLAMSLVVQYP